MTSPLTEETREVATSLIEVCREEWQREPSSLDAAYNLGLLLGHVGSWEETIDPLSAVVAGRPGFANAKAKLGHSLLIVAYAQNARGSLPEAVGRFQRAADLLREASLDQSLEGVQWDLGLCLWELGDREQALQAMRAEIQEFPHEQRSVFLAARLNELAYYSDSIDVLKQAAIISPSILTSNQLAMELLKASREERTWTSVLGDTWKQ